MKVVIFGTGLFYEKRKQFFPADAEILAFLDNNRDLWGKELDGKKIVSPEDVWDYEFDKIVLMSRSAKEMRRQLLALDIDGKKIVTWSQWECGSAHGKFQFFCGNELSGTRARILILSTPLGYSGAPVTAMYATKALQMKGYNVVLCAKDGNPEFIDEIVNEGINVMLCSAIPYLGREELFWVRQFDIVLANTFLMMPCACEISQYKPLVWWIHECGERFENYYSDTVYEFSEYIDKVRSSRMDILGVSDVAKYNFSQYFPARMYKTLSYGIPDDGYTEEPKRGRLGKVVFAVIGTICKRKGQKVFLEAAGLMGNEARKKAEFWIVGIDGDNEYTEDVIEKAKQYESVHLKGELSRREMGEIYKMIDVVVCPSLEETMSIVLTEGIMYGKVCITTNATGMAEYITDKVNGIVCEAGDARALGDCMKWVLENEDKTRDIKKRARETYEQYFTLQRFADRLEEAVLSAKENFL